MIGIWKLAPALAAGNTVVIKPSEHASVSTLEFMRLIEEAEVPPGVVNVVTGFAQEVGEALVAHPRVAKVSFTGSDKAGRQVNLAAAGDFKRVTLEMGGKSPQIVFEDADLESAVHGVVSGIFLSNGQTCVAGSRLLVQDTIKEAFLEKLTAIARAARMGDPMAADTQIGPIANRPQHDKILDYIGIAKAEGARCILGGRSADRPECGEGLFVEPTIFVDVTPKMRIAREEVFGPLLAVIPFRDEDEAIAIANDSLYGLAAGVWTKDLRRAHLMARRLESGTVYVNTYRGVSVTSPVGGYKHSGFGRENGAEAIKEFLQIKSVWINMAEKTQNPFAPAET